jgi:Flp pilus assembly pilin Flp
LLNLIQAFVGHIKTREEGQTIVEYGLVIGGISLVLIAGIAVGLGDAFTDLFTSVTDAMNGP